MIKTPLRYPGGKSRMAKRIVDMMPPTMESYYEGFLGGGSVALEVSKRYPDVAVHVNDLWYPLYSFWCVLSYYPEELQYMLLNMKAESENPDGGRKLFEDARERVSSMDQVTLENACAFYIVNKCGFSGLVSSYSPQAWTQNFTVRCIEALADISELTQNWKITNDEWSEWKDSSCIYLDPPYEIKANLYGNRGEMHKEFDHDDFVKRASMLYGRNVIISYNCEMGNKFSSEWSKIVFDHTYTMRSTGDYMKNQKERKELLLQRKF